jgi:hypothetical protein
VIRVLGEHLADAAPCGSNGAGPAPGGVYAQSDLSGAKSSRGPVLEGDPWPPGRLDMLLTAIGIPDLAGARRVGSTTWDLLPRNHPDHDHNRAAALRQCVQCPALLACGQYLDA